MYRAHYVHEEIIKRYSVSKQVNLYQCTLEQPHTNKTRHEKNTYTTTLECNNEESKAPVVCIEEFSLGPVRTLPTLPRDLVSEPCQYGIRALLKDLAIGYPELVSFYRKACQRAL